jgi:hypothetical protein
MICSGITDDLHCFDRAILLWLGKIVRMEVDR